MRQYIRYLYEYENGKRIRNVGFVRVEEGESNCIIHIHGKGLRLKTQTDMEVYVFYKDGNTCMGIRQGEIRNVNPSINYRLEYGHDDVGGPDRFGEIEGIILSNYARPRYAAVWNDAPADIENMVVVGKEVNFPKAPDPEQQTQSDSGSADSDISIREERTNEEQENRSEQFAPVQPMMPEPNEENVSEPNLESESNSSGEMMSASEPSPSEEMMSASEPSPSEEMMSASEPNANQGKMPASEPNASEEMIPASEPNASEEMIPASESNTNEEIPPEPELNANEEMMPEPEPNASEEMIPASELNASEETMSEPEPQEKVMSEWEKKNQRMPWSKSREQRTPGQDQKIQMMPERKPQNQMHPEPENNVRPAAADNEEAVKGQEQKEEGVKFQKITREGIARLPRREWRLANNSFLLHGYYNYHHLVIMEEGENQFLGVPGIYHAKEKPAAEAFGFGNFVKWTKDKMELSNEECSDNDDFGYWYRQVSQSKV